VALDHYFVSFLPFPWPINYNHAFQNTKFFTHSSLSQFWSKIFPFIKFIALHMIMFYKFQITQMIKDLPWKSSLNLTLTQHPCNEDPKPWKMRLHFKVEHLWAWYYQNFPNFHTLVILLQVNLTFSNEFTTMYEGFYEIKNILIFAWSSIPNIGHYHWLGSSIH